MTTTIKSNKRLTREEKARLLMHLPCTGVLMFDDTSDGLVIEFDGMAHREMFFLYESNRQNFDVIHKILVDPAAFYQRAKEMHDGSRNLPEEWKATELDELTACLDDIRDLCTKDPSFSEMEAMAERFAKLIPANYGMLVNMHLQ